MMGSCDMLIEIYSLGFYQLSMCFRDTKKAVEWSIAKANPVERNEPVIYEMLRQKMSQKRA